MRTIEKFNESVKDFENHFNNLPFEFEFRENQKEYIIDIAKSIYLDSGKTVKILDAPTGSGKKYNCFRNFYDFELLWIERIYIDF